MQGVHAVAPVDGEKLEPSEQGVHTLSDVVVQEALRYVPAGHGFVEQGVHDVAPLMLEKLEPSKHGKHTPLSDVVVQGACS